MGSISHRPWKKKHPIHKPRWYSLQHARDLNMANNNLTRNGGALSLSVGVVGRNWQRLSFLQKLLESYRWGWSISSFQPSYVYTQINMPTVPSMIRAVIFWMVNVDHRGASYHVFIYYIHIIIYNHIYICVCPKFRNPLNQVVGKSSICCFDGLKEVPKRFPKWWWFPW